MIISLVKIINHNFWIFYIGRKDRSLYNKQKNTWVIGNTDLFLVLNMILTRKICSTLEKNAAYPYTILYIIVVNISDS